MADGGDQLALGVELPDDGHGLSIDAQPVWIDHATRQHQGVKASGIDILEADIWAGRPLNHATLLGPGYPLDRLKIDRSQRDLGSGFEQRLAGLEQFGKAIAGQHQHMPVGELGHCVLPFAAAPKQRRFR